MGTSNAEEREAKARVLLAELYEALAQAGEGPMEWRVPEELKEMGAIMADLDFAMVTLFRVGCCCTL